MGIGVNTVDLNLGGGIEGVVLLVTRFECCGGAVWLRMAKS